MLPPVELYVDEVTPSRWYHPLMPLVFRILWMIPGFTAQRMGRFVAKGNGLPENMASKSISAHSTEDEDYSLGVY